MIILQTNQGYLMLLIIRDALQIDIRFFLIGRDCQLQASCYIPIALEGTGKSE